ncbi:acyl-CoA dehydrogenase family protein [Sphingopyxis sp.]|uniref:acyl-CoA dehydrogenase family protein n=1 Tax=Sphingopyxis sp. TaxID=1908224 RepID=UPI003D11060D
MPISPEDEAFREEVRAFFAAELTPELRRAGKLMTSVYADHASQMAWQAKLHAKGWAAPAWPVEYGGCDWSVVQHHIFASERVRAGAPPVSPMGIKMCGPAIIGFGSEEQKAFFLPRMLNGEHFWCQGYSEPGAGSDLAALQMKAVRDGDDLVCTGTKIWTTHANVANWIFCLVRTAKTDRKQQGISFLLIDMNSPGIEVRPIIMASGEHIQNQIFFDNVRVPVANVLGEIDNGWTVAKYLLEFERGGSAYAPEIEVALDGLAQQVAAQPAGPARILLDVRIAEARIRCDILARLESDILSCLSAGAPTGADASMMKILGTELNQYVTELALDAAGPLARAFQPGVAMPGGPIPGHVLDDYCSGEVWQAIAPLHYLNERASSIYAGTNEIQRGILAKAELRI